MSEDNKILLDENGDLKLNDEFLEDISGGSNPEEVDEECLFNCSNSNCGCKEK
ncbi:hypothetical protein [Rheinheimera sp.]|uniref:hypothetical protein n=1 Tax=Rheinheimera sp. TaxID=1869214 RepID=UPI002FDD3547